MAPRKRAASSSSSSSTRKSNQNNQQSQPSKFGIQHFFDRHSQAAAAAAAAAVAPRNTNPDLPNPSPNPPNPNPSPTSNLNSSQITPSPADQPPPAAIADAEGSSLQISPEISKSAPLKRFRFSPGMLIKQSQDDAGDEVTWKISPINERLRSITAKQLPGMMRFFPDVSRPSNSSLQPCSLKQVSSCSEGRLEKWLSSPTSTLQEKPLPSSRRASLQDPEVSNDAGSNIYLENVGTMDFRSPFQTPPSARYGPIKLVGATTCNGTPDHLGPLQHRKALLELLDQVEDAITEEVLPDDPMLCKDHGLVDDKINNVHDPIDKNVVAAPPERIYAVSHDITFLVLEVSEKHKSTGSSCVRSPFKVLLGTGVAFVE